MFINIELYLYKIYKQFRKDSLHNIFITYCIDSSINIANNPHKLNIYIYILYEVTVNSQTEHKICDCKISWKRNRKDIQHW